MKAITLHQPYATAIAIGAKTVETRSWPTSHRGTLAIHAAVRRPPLVTFIGDHWHVAQGATWLHGPGHDAPMPFGAVVAVATVTACVPIRGDEAQYDQASGDWIVDTRPWYDGKHGSLRRIATSRFSGSVSSAVTDLADQQPWGDWTPGRWGWMLTDVQPLAEPVPCRGFQRLWTLPPEVEAQVLPQLTGWPT